MKKLNHLILLLLLISTIQLWSQEKENSSIPLIGTEAPSFKAESTNGKINFPEDFGKSWKIIFSHPQDFTPVCSSELLELSYLQPEFDKLGVNVLVVSTDKLSQHFEWKANLETISYEGRDPRKINFALVSDENYIISKKYGMFHHSVSTAKDIRGVYIIDPDNIVQSVSFYPMSVGRNMDEYVRTIQALQTAKDNLVTPANWKPGDDVMLSYLSAEDKAEQLKGSQSAVYELAWFMIYKKLP